MGAREDLLAIREELDRLRERVDQALAATAADAAGASGEPIENLDLPRRALTCLRKAGIETVGQLAAKAYRDMWRMPNCGRYTVRDIERALAARGLKLRGERLDMGGWRPERAPRGKPNAQATQE
ncbi:MAG: hypothetical protein NTW87_25045 [Planctomycetota bacterium]|nr:hypothetical protein [Planctomycetota bacterium]